jgi:hypothetical protein
MRRLPSAALAFALTATATTAFAQNQARPNGPPAGGEVRGIITAAEGAAPLAHAGVAVRGAADSALVTGAITGADGVFHIRGLRPGQYYIRVTLLGFRPLTRSFAITPAAPVQDLGTIGLAQIAVALQEKKPAEGADSAAADDTAAADTTTDTAAAADAAASTD